MKLWLKAGGIAALTWLQASTSFAIKEGDILPQVAIESVAGSTSLTNGSLADKVTIVNFWATWCAACKVEIKEFETAFAEFMPNAKFQVAFVALDKNPEDAKAWFSENVKNERFRAQLYADASFAAAESLAVDSFPMTLVIDQAGKVRFIQRGFEEGSGSTEKIAALVRTLL